jgi:TonB family protein
MQVQLVIHPDGNIWMVDGVKSSGSSVLDAAAVAMFRNAHLPPFPPAAPAQPGHIFAQSQRKILDMHPARGNAPVCRLGSAEGWC